MTRLTCVLVLVALAGMPAFAGPTKIRPGQIDFSGGIHEDVRVVGDLDAAGTTTADILAVTGEATIGGRAEVGGSANDLTITAAAASFNTRIGAATEPEWIFDGANYHASPKREGLLKKGLLSFGLSPGTRLYRVIAHGVFADSDAGNELRARVYKLNVAAPTTPTPLTSESVETGGTPGAFSITVTPDYVVEEGYAVMVRIEIKNTNAEKTLFFGVELVLHETAY